MSSTFWIFSLNGWGLNGYLEIAWSSLALDRSVIAGEVVIPFVSEGVEGFDINEHEDWVLAEYLLNNKNAKLPYISI